MKCKLLLLIILSLVFTGCASRPLPSEDIEAPKLNARWISVLKDPQLKPNSKEKYDAIRKLIKNVDFTFTRETKTINEFFSPHDAIIDLPQAIDRRITFNYQYRDNYVRLTFYTYREFVVRVDISEK